MELQTSINKENLKVLMTLFYVKAVNDEELGPFFINELGEDMDSEEWQEHIELLGEFWLAKLLGEKTYEGNVFGMHTRVPNIKRESFVIWMKLFSITIDEVYTDEISTLFKNKAKLFSEQFITFLKI